MTAGRRAKGLRAIVTATALAAGALASPACGAAIDLGGTSDAAALDATGDVSRPEGAAPCDPCASPDDCNAKATCAQIADGGDTFCATACPTGGGCGSDETCGSSSLSTGDVAKVCVPKSGACATAVGPSSPDGAPVERCGDLVGPSVTASCRACHQKCQPNGCYSGWWCNVETRRCQRPPKRCP